jgi:hypothetical protein
MVMGESRKLLLMGSAAFKARELPLEVRDRIDDAIQDGMTIVVGEAQGACRLYQDYLRSRGYDNVIVGHALKIRYNAGNWKEFQYGSNMKEREQKMIEDCESAIIIWVDQSGQIAKNLEMLKRLWRPTFVYEYSTKTNTAKAGMLDPKRTYDRFRYFADLLRMRHAKEAV